MQGFLSLIEASGIATADVPRALALALARHLGVTESEATAQVAAFGGDLLMAMAIPPAHRIAFLKAAPDERESFLDTLAAAAHGGA